MKNTILYFCLSIFCGKPKMKYYSYTNQDWIYSQNLCRMRFQGTLQSFFVTLYSVVIALGHNEYFLFCRVGPYVDTNNTPDCSAVPSKETLRLLCCRMQTAHPRVTLFSAVSKSAFASFHHFHHVLPFKTLQPLAQPYTQRNCASSVPAQNVVPTGDGNIIFNLLNYYTELYLKKNISRTYLRGQMAPQINSSLTSNLLV